MKARSMTYRDNETKNEMTVVVFNDDQMGCSVPSRKLHVSCVQRILLICLKHDTALSMILTC